MSAFRLKGDDRCRPVADIPGWRLAFLMGTPTSGYVYIATSEGLTQSYVGVSASLLDMEWIAKFGVDNLVWFEGYSDVSLAQTRADALWSMSEYQRRSLILGGNPTMTDLSPRIWGSDKEGA